MVERHWLLSTSRACKRGSGVIIPLTSGRLTPPAHSHSDSLSSSSDGTVSQTLGSHPDLTPRFTWTPSLSLRSLWYPFSSFHFIMLPSPYYTATKLLQQHRSTISFPLLGLLSGTFTPPHFSNGAEHVEIHSQIHVSFMLSAPFNEGIVA